MSKFLAATVCCLCSCASAYEHSMLTNTAKKYNVPAHYLHNIAIIESNAISNGKTIVWPWSVVVNNNIYQFKTRNDLFAYLVKKRYNKEQVLFGISRFNLSSYKSKSEIWKATSPALHIEVIARFISYKSCNSISKCYKAYKSIQKSDAQIAKTRVRHNSRKNFAKIPEYLKPLIKKASDETGVDAALIAAVITQESRFKVNAKSHAGAMGLMQLMPDTAKYLGLAKSDFYHPEKNINAGAQYLREQLNTFSNVEFALAAYNAGPGAVKKYKGIPPYRETQKYVPKVVSYYRHYKGQGL